MDCRFIRSPQVGEGLYSFLTNKQYRLERVVFVLYNIYMSHGIAHIRRFGKRKDKAVHWLVYVAGIATPIITIPQLLKIWTGDATGVSLFTWVAYTVGAAIFATYGFAHRDKPLIVTYVPLTIVDILVVIGLLI